MSSVLNWTLLGSSLVATGLAVTALATFLSKPYWSETTPFAPQWTVHRTVHQDADPKTLRVEQSSARELVLKGSMMGAPKGSLHDRELYHWTLPRDIVAFSVSGTDIHVLDIEHYVIHLTWFNDVHFQKFIHVPHAIHISNQGPWWVASGPSSSSPSNSEDRDRPTYTYIYHKDQLIAKLPGGGLCAITEDRLLKDGILYLRKGSEYVIDQNLSQLTIDSAQFDADQTLWIKQGPLNLGLKRGNC